MSDRLCAAVSHSSVPRRHRYRFGLVIISTRTHTHTHTHQTSVSVVAVAVCCTAAALPLPLSPESLARVRAEWSCGAELGQRHGDGAGRSLHRTATHTRERWGRDDGARTWGRAGERERTATVHHTDARTHTHGGHNDASDRGRQKEGGGYAAERGQRRRRGSAHQQRLASRR